MSCGADTLSITLLNTLMDGKRFDLPDTDLTNDLYQIPAETSDLYQEIQKLTNEDLTTRVVDGSGVFDALMSGLSSHLKREYEQNRITGEQYTKAYIAAMEAGLGQGTVYLLERDKAYWANLLTQQQARLTEVQVVTARVETEIAKARLAEARIRILIAEAEYGLTKMKIATEDQQYCLLKEQTTQTIAQTAHIETETTLTEKQIDTQVFTNDFMLPAQHSGVELDNDTKQFNLSNIMPLERDGLELDNDTKTYNLANILPAQRANIEAETDIKDYTASQLLPAQKADVEADTEIKEYNVNQILPAQRAGIEADNDIKEFNHDNILPAQEKLLEEQAEAQRAQTHDTRLDGSPVRGSVGKQKDLYDQQIDSYQRDAEIKAAKLFTDAWITQKTIDELTEPPGAFRLDSYNAVLRNIKANNNLDNDPGSQDGDPG